MESKCDAGVFDRKFRVSMNAVRTDTCFDGVSGERCQRGCACILYIGQAVLGKK